MPPMSNIKVPLNRVIEQLGGVNATANAFGVTRQTVWNWKKRRVPAEKCLPLCEAVGHTVSPKELRPDIFGANE